MNLGTAEIVEDIPKPKRGGSGLSVGSGPTNGGGHNPGGGNDKPGSEDDLGADRFIPNKSRILTALLLLVVMMTFGGLMAAYIVIATNNVAEWKPFDLPIQVWISTAIIFSSSITYHLGKNAIKRNDNPVLIRWLVATTILGAAFISSQLLVWLSLASRGLYVQSNPYAGFFYILTAVHAIHVLGGIVALGSVLLRSWQPTDDPDKITKRITIAQVVGWYWHFMGGIWILLLILLGFWK
ncbi:MAG: heme-copper oxidase subunit III [Pyrinomonadaceae bacterium]